MKKNNKILASVKYIHAKITSTITNELLQYIINKMYGKKNGIHQTQTNEQSTKSGLNVLP